MTKKRLFLFSKESRGGIGTFFNNLSGLKNKGFSLSLYLYKKDPLFDNKNQLDTHYPKGKYPSEIDFAWRKIFEYITHVFSTFYILFNKKPDVICCNDTYSILTVIPLKMFFGNISMIAIMHSDLIQIIRGKKGKIYKKVLYRYYSFVLKQIDHIVFVSEGTREDYINKFKLNSEKTSVIYYGIELPSHKSRKESSKVVRLISVGRFEKQKDFATIIKSFSIVQKNTPVELVLIGEGGEEKSLLELSKNKCKRNSVKFLGWKGQEEIYKYLKESDIFIFSSLYETFGMTVVEAMACGLPVIATDTPHGPRESLAGGRYGIIIPVGDYFKMASAIKELIQDNGHRNNLSNLSLKRSKLFSSERMVDDYASLFKTFV